MEMVDLAYTFTRVNKGDKLITVKKTEHEDFKEARENPILYKTLPSGTVVEFESIEKLFGKKFLICNYRGIQYKLDPHNLEKT
jgi:hypothetical protein